MTGRPAEIRGSAQARRDLARTLSRELLEGDGTLASVGRPHGLGASQVAALFRADGLPRMREIQARRRHELARRLWERLSLPGNRLSDAARALGVSPSRASTLLRAEGYDVKAALSRQHAERTAAMWRRHRDDGLTLEQVGDEHGVGVRHVVTLLAEAGLVVRHHVERDAQRQARVEAMWARRTEDGWTLAQIGGEFGLTRERVRQIFVSAGLPTRRQSGRRAPS